MISPKSLLATLLGTVMLTGPAFAQSAPAANAPAPAATTASVTNAGQWRASKLIGANVYNQQNEKLGDISELLMDPSGRIQGVVIGVGGFLGIGEHDVLVSMDKLKWVDEPVRASTSSTPPANTTGTAANTPRPGSSASEKWYPDHAVLNASKDQIKSMSQFKYN